MIHYEDLQDYEFVQSSSPIYIGVDPWLETRIRIKYDSICKKLTFLQQDIIGRELRYAGTEKWQKDTNELANKMRDKGFITYGQLDGVGAILNAFFAERYHPIGMIYTSSITSFVIMSDDKGVPWKIKINDYEFRIDKKIEK